MTDTKRRDRNSLLALIALCFFAIFIVVTTIVMQKIHASSAMQDCLASGRTNCAPIDTTHH